MQQGLKEIRQRASILWQLQLEMMTAIHILAFAVTALLGTATLLAYSWKYFNSWFFIRPLKLEAQGQKLPPGSLGWPLFGEMREFLQCFKTEKPDRFVQLRQERYGKGGLYTTGMFGSPCIMATRPEVLKFVLKRDDLFGPGWPSTKVMGASSVTSVTGELHKCVRRYLFDAVGSPEGMRKALPHVEATMRITLKQWADMENINVRACTKTLTFNVIVGNFFSLTPPSPQTDSISDDYDGFMAGIRAYPLYFPGTAHYTAMHCRRRLEANYQAFINSRKLTGEHKEDFLQGLMDARDPDGVPLTDQQITDNLIAMTLAGYESSAHSMMWILILLEQHPECVAKLREEHIQIKKRRGDAQLTLEDIKQMAYTRKIIDETLRLVNVAPMTFRTVLRDIDFKGYRLPKGWKVMPWLRAPHMDPEFFPEPARFNPDRWDDKDLNMGAYNPFGGGARTCVGNQFAKLQVSVFLHHLALGYKWKNLSPKDIKVVHLPHPKPVDGCLMHFSTCDSYNMAGQS